ncbi:hypothetical protein AX16_004321 [Volvariella volvacea WC 439]|nr:hypothetical protein AX16_004321 [Volvariella volvacea WC 439]
MMISESLRSVPLTEIFARVNSIVHIDTVVECCGNHSSLGRSQRQAFLHPSHDVVLFATAPEQSQAISLLVNPTDVPVAFKIKVPSRYSKRYSIQPNKGILNPQKWVKIAFVFREDDWDGSFKDMSIRIVTVGLKSWRRSSGASSVTSSIASLASVASEQDIWQNEDARTHVMQVIHQEKRLDIQSSNGCFAI